MMFPLRTATLLEFHDDDDDDLYLHVRNYA